MGEFILTLLNEPAFRSLVEGIAVKVVADLFHRRSTDPAFLASSDAAFAGLSAAKTDEEKSNALFEIQRLMASG